ncbi:putative secreted protein (Por secretion system target) [Ulvibacter sp. MAR_2010_11]|uniref:T9SS type A sorting domain-containing protein n=1 Tax=Ulvibacter sp. MAR_2010_11 TaxID=1250229 RepID=UPI000CABE7BE|nr:T9SS type A sorting domain-containing protein [Ulvibacter sp. MAR_2010_11]PKA83819.1 putative secreted protein (Por secretion system target) [Ulvibacter sp. MAR_2010_11]
MLLILLLACGSWSMFGQNSNQSKYGPVLGSTAQVANIGSSNPQIGDCDTTVKHENLDNGLYFGGSINHRIAVDIDVAPQTLLTINTINITAGSYPEPTYFHFKFYKDENGFPGDLISEVTNSAITAMDTLHFIKFEIGYIRDVTIVPETPIELSGDISEKYWMEVSTDAKAWSVSPDASDVIGLPLISSGNNEPWFYWVDLEAQYHLDADCSPILGIGDVTGSRIDIIVYPNPVNDLLTIKAPMDTVETVQLYTLTGQKLIDGQFRNQLDLSEYDAGIYFLQIKLKNGKVIYKRVLK